MHLDRALVTLDRLFEGSPSDLNLPQSEQCIYVVRVELKSLLKCRFGPVELLGLELNETQKRIIGAVVWHASNLRFHASHGLRGLLLALIHSYETLQGLCVVWVTLQSLLEQLLSFRIFLLGQAVLA